MVRDVATRLLGDMAEGAARDDVWPEAQWAAIEEAGLPLVLVAEGAGGFALPPADALAIAALAARVASPLPLADTLVANWLLAEAGIDPATGPVALCDTALSLRREGEGWLATGELARVAWGRRAAIVAMAAAENELRLVRIPATTQNLQSGSNIAGEPRDTLVISARLTDADVGRQVSADTVRLAGAVVRTVQIAGALEAILDRTLTFVRERSQFGKALSGFQVVQHHAAIMAEEVAAGQVAADLAIEALDGDRQRRAEAIAAAKLRAGEAAGKVAAIAHQLHGAMGFSLEYSLHRLVRRLWAWRDEFGSETFWAEKLGRSLAVAGADGLWPELTVI